jgi:hypothetical protein
MKGMLDSSCSVTDIAANNMCCAQCNHVLAVFIVVWILVVNLDSPDMGRLRFGPDLFKPGHARFTVTVPPQPVLAIWTVSD